MLEVGLVGDGQRLERVSARCLVKILEIATASGVAMDVKERRTYHQR